MAKKTDEGWRYLKVLDFSVEWYDLGTNFIQPACTDALRKRADDIRPYSLSGKLVLFIIPVLSPTCVTPHQSILSVPRSRQYCQLPPGGSQGVVVGSFRHSIGCYRHPTLRAAGCRPYRAGKSFAPIKTFNLPLSPFQFAPIGSPLYGGEPIGFESGITCSRGLRQPEPCRLRCRCTSRSSW